MLQKLRAKPNHIKKSIALAITTVIFLCILFVWVSSWDARNQRVETRDKAVSPAIGVFSMFEGLVEDIKEGISGTPSFIEAGASSTFPTATQPASATSFDTFDISGVVILDSTSTVRNF